MAGSSREQALSLLAAANNHGDLAVKLSSLRQVKGLLTVESSLGAEVFAFLAELQSSPEGLVRKFLVEVIEEIGLKVLEHSSILMPVLMSLVKDRDPIVACQAITSGMKFFCAVLEDMALQFHHHGKVDRRIEEIWIWVLRFKDTVHTVISEAVFIKTRLLALKFLETFILMFTPDATDSDRSTSGGVRSVFNISRLVRGHPVLDLAAVTSEANRSLLTLLDLLRSANTLPVPLIITVVN